MRVSVEAIFEDGVFKPVEPPDIPDGKHVRLTIETAARPGREDPLELALRVYRGFRPEEIDEIERIALGSRTRGWE